MQPVANGLDQRLTSIVVDCPVCSRVMWAGARCDHGRVVALETAGPVKPAAPDVNNRFKDSRR